MNSFFMIFHPKYTDNPFRQAVEDIGKDLIVLYQKTPIKEIVNMIEYIQFPKTENWESEYYLINEQFHSLRMRAERA